MTPPTVNAYYNPAKNEIVVPGGHPAAAVLLPGGRRRHQLRRDRRRHRPRDHARLRRLGPQVRRAGQPGRLVDRSGREDLRRAREVHHPAVRRLLRRAGPPPERRARAGRVDRRPRRADDRLPRVPEEPRGQARARLRSTDSSADQRFFLAWARIWASNNRPEFARLLVQTNEHPLGKYRAIGTVVNMPEFAKAFSCSAGTPMVKEVNCQIW